MYLKANKNQVKTDSNHHCYAAFELTISRVNLIALFDPDLL